MMKNFNNNKGITLITLVVTIVVLAILIGVVGASLIKDDNVVTESKELRKATRKEDIISKVRLYLLSQEIEKKKNNETYTVENKKRDIKTKFANEYTFSVEAGYEILKTKDGKTKILLNDLIN